MLCAQLRREKHEECAASCPRTPTAMLSASSLESVMKAMASDPSFTQRTGIDLNGQAQAIKCWI